MSPRASYTTSQVHQIYDRISLPAQHRKPPHDDSTKFFARGPHGLPWLAALQRHALSTIPFESLSLHYSPDHRISIDPQDVFTKIVTQNTGRGGYCMELNAFFGTFLRALGFEVLSTGGRVNSNQSASESEAEVSYMGWSHMVNIVTVDKKRYLVDIGFGSGGPTRPIRLVHLEKQCNIAPDQYVRLKYEALAQNEDERAKLWILERRERGVGAGWRAVYCFPDYVEFLPGDYEVMNLHTSTSPTSFFTYTVLCTKCILDEHVLEIIGTTVLFGKSVYKQVRGVKGEPTTFETESDRVKSLEEWFGITLSTEQQLGIIGTPSAI
ncbi:hypothetical protein B0A48_15762 [Cryoendolithus antarcticus]|uniref:Uncharacterized protein n=1 Tax=Cryoendolithus antarcticus TaxID=1507870 RepID=A0A1V8SI05_9PEZI|nr:hypothetical protein B0A48_15762 [Cryoendolithus antarcticus]